VPDISLFWPGFPSGSVYVGFVVWKVALGKVFSSRYSIWFSPADIISLWPVCGRGSETVSPRYKRW
jgi:hypothetical protein